mgnify:FL=1
MSVNKFKPFVFGTIYAILGLGRVVFAENPGSIVNPLKYDSFAGLVQAFADLLTKIGIPIASIFIIYSGFLFVSARGNPEQLKTAKSTLWWTLVGTAILVGAYAISSAIVNFAQKL